MACQWQVEFETFCVITFEYIWCLRVKEIKMQWLKSKTSCSLLKNERIVILECDEPLLEGKINYIQCHIIKRISIANKLPNISKWMSLTFFKVVFIFTLIGALLLNKLVTF